MTLLGLTRSWEMRVRSNLMCGEEKGEGKEMMLTATDGGSAGFE